MGLDANLKLMHRAKRRGAVACRGAGAGFPVSGAGAPQPSPELQRPPLRFGGLNVYEKDGKLEYPPEHIGSRKYVTVYGYKYSVPVIYCFMGSDRRWYVIGMEGPESNKSAMVMSDLQPYHSPLDGNMVTSRSQHRDSMRRHGVIEMGNERPKYCVPDVSLPRAGHDIKRAMGKL